MSFLRRRGRKNKSDANNDEKRKSSRNAAPEKDSDSKVDASGRFELDADSGSNEEALGGLHPVSDLVTALAGHRASSRQAQPRPSEKSGGTPKSSSASNVPRDASRGTLDPRTEDPKPIPVAAAAAADAAEIAAAIHSVAISSADIHAAEQATANAASEAAAQAAKLVAAGAPERAIDPTAPAIETVITPPTELVGDPAALSSPEQIVAAGNVRLPKDPPGAERRRRRRVKLGMRVLVRGGVGTLDSFDDITSSVDVSRDGLLLITERPGYWVHQPVEVVFPYSPNQDSSSPAQKARILRASQLPDQQRWALAVELKAPRAEDVGEYASAPITRQVKVLAVETDPQMGNVVKELLLGDGYQVVVVQSAREALELLNNDVPDIILAEVECGSISGNDLCTIIKNDDRFSHIPVILMTNNAKPADYALGHQAGAVVCMAKPYPPARLHHAVRLIAPPPFERSSYSARANISSFVRTS